MVGLVASAERAVVRLVGVFAAVLGRLQETPATRAGLAIQTEKLGSASDIKSRLRDTTGGDEVTWRATKIRTKSGNLITLLITWSPAGNHQLHGTDARAVRRDRRQPARRRMWFVDLTAVRRSQYVLANPCPMRC
jgi:hypothetical protein